MSYHSKKDPRDFFNTEVHLVIADRRYNHLIDYLSNIINGEYPKTLSEIDKVQKAQKLLYYVYAAENTQYDEEFGGVLVMLKQSDLEEIICLLIDLLPPVAEKKKMKLKLNKVSDKQKDEEEGV